MDLVQLKYFVHAATLRSISKASSQLNVAQPAITRQVRRLEEDIGEALFVRHNRGLHLTAAGELLLERARALLRMADDIKLEVRSSESSPSGKVRFGFVPSTGPQLVAAALKSCMAASPLVAIQAVEAYSHVLEDKLIGGQIDLAVMTVGVRRKALIMERLFEEDLWVASSPQLPRLKKLSSVKQLEGLPLIQPSAENPLRMLVEQKAHDAGVELNVRAEVDGISMLKELAREALAYFVAPYSSICADLKARKLAGCAIEGMVIRRFLVRPAGRPPTRATMELATHVYKARDRVVRTNRQHLRV